MIWSLVEGTAKIVSENALFDHRVATSLDQLRASVGLPPEELKTAALEAVSNLTEMIDERREHDALDQALVQRITSLTNDLEEARREAGSDPLTGLASRRVLEQELGRAITMRALSSDPLCVLLIDLDRFKDVNDEFGHVGGDDALRAAAHRLTRVFPRSSDLVARLGGDEFVVLLRYAGHRRRPPARAQVPRRASGGAGLVERGIVHPQCERRRRRDRHGRVGHRDAPPRGRGDVRRQARGRQPPRRRLTACALWSDRHTTDTVSGLTRSVPDTGFGVRVVVTCAPPVERSTHNWHAFGLDKICT